MNAPYGHCSELMRDYPITEESRIDYLSRYKPFICLNLTNKCTHNCWYCIGGKPAGHQLEGVADEMGIDAYIDALHGLAGGHICTYRISGGEPMEHPAFYRVTMGLLEKGHDVDIVSNLLYFSQIGTESMSKFRSQINFEISYHLGEYIHDASGTREMAWFESYKLACASGRSIHPIVPMTPEILKMDCEAKLDLLQEIAMEYDCDFEPNLIELYAKIDGKSYPKDYTKEEMDRIFELRNKYYKVKPIRENVDRISEINKELFLCGLDCFYMTRLIYVLWDGQIRICDSGVPADSVGNIKNGFTFKIGSEPKPCAFKKCVCLAKAEVACLNPAGIDYATYMDYYKKWGEK